MAFPALLTAALAASLTVQSGETWLFRLAHGQPSAARRAAADSLPKPGEIRVTARRMLGTTLTMLNNSHTAYTFRATLVGADGKAIVGKSCVLPADNRLTMESWPQVAVAVRIADFKPTKAGELLMAKLYFYYAAMNAGKSTTLLQADFNYRERGMETMLWTAAFDDRSGHGQIGSRIALSAAAATYAEDTDLLAEILAERQRRDLHCVLLDEAQFLTRDHVLQLCRVADELGVPVLCYGLRTDFRGELFPGSAALLALADSLIELKAVCECGRKATMNLRVDAEGHAVAAGAQTEIGGNDRYIALCRRHFFERLNESEARQLALDIPRR